MRPARAMTLVEVLAALAILVVLSGGVIGFFLGVSARRDELARLAAQQRDVASFFDRLEAALTGAIALAPDGSAGVNGDERSLTLVTRSVTPALEGDASVADAVSIAFSFDQAGAACRCAVTPLLGEEGGVREPILEHVERVRFRYLRGRGWNASFDSLQAAGLPGAIEVSVWLEPRTGPRAPGAPGAGPAGDERTPEPRDPARDETSPLVPMDLPPEPEEIPWTPREPDHVRVMVVPDGPGMRQEGPSP